MASDLLRRLKLAVLLSTQLVVILDGQIVTVALPTLRDDLGVSDVGLAWVVNAFVLTFAVSLLPAGRAGDVIGARRIFIAGLVLFLAASVACGLAWSPTSLVLARAVQGAGAGLASAVVLGMIADLYRGDPGGRARAFGLVAFVGAGGASLGTVGGGVLTDTLGWRSTFLVNVPICGLALIGALTLLKPDRVEHHPARGLTGALGRVLRNSSFVTLTAVLLTMTFAGFSFQFLSALYLQDVLGLDALTTGLAFLAVTASVAVASLAVSPLLVRRWGSRRVLVTGLVLFVLGLALLARFPADGAYPADVAPPFVLAGLGFGLAVTQVTDMAMASADPAHTGLSSGLVATAQQVGGLIGLTVVPVIAATRTRAVSGDLSPGASAASGLQLGLSIAVAVLATGALVAARWAFLHREETGRAAAEV